MNTKLTLWENIWFPTANFIESWVYPAYFLRNLLFHRYDLIKLSKLKPYDYCEPDCRIELAMFQEIENFVDNDSNHIEWYGPEGPKYNKDLYPELKGRYIFDIIKEIYDWNKTGRAKFMEDYTYVMNLVFDMLHKISWETMKKDPKNPDLEFVKPVTCSPKITDEYLNSLNLNWEILNKFDINNEILKNKDLIFQKINYIDKLMIEKNQYYLHLIVEVRPYLWTF